MVFVFFSLNSIRMLDKVIRFSITNKPFIGLLTLVLIVWGVWSATRLPVDAVPDITDNQVQIITTSPSLAGQEVEQLVTFPIEQSLANLPGLAATRSISRFGLSVVTAVFDEDVDIYFARQLVSERLREAEQQIPAGVGTPELAPVSTGLGEVYQYILHPRKGSEGKYSPADLRTMQDWIVARQLYGTRGVAEINSFGGELKQYEVAVRPDRLKAFDLSIADLFTALESNNENTGGAYIDKQPNAYFIRGVGLVKSLDDVRNICVRTGATGIPIRVGDVADVRFGHAVRYGAMTFDGKVDAVGGVVMMLKGENSSEVVRRIKEKLPVVQRSLPSDVVIEPYLDRTDLVGRAIATVERNLVEGALIVIFVLVLFLGNWRAGLVVASAIPLSLLFALGMMHLFGVSANLMSLGAIDFGIIIDGSVIVVEATLHHLSQRRSPLPLSRREMDEEVYRATSSIRSSAMFGEVIILMVYIPILTLVGIEGKMFRPMAQTVSFAIVGALVISLTYIPMMSALCLPKTPPAGSSFSDRMMQRLTRLYVPLFARSLRVRRYLLGGTVALFLLTVGIFSRMGGEFIPQLQEGDYAFHCILPQGSSLSQSLETSMQASRLIKEFEEVKMVVGKTGSAEVPTDPMPPEATDLMVILHPQDTWKSGRTYAELADAIEERLSVLPGVFFEKNQPIQMRFNELMTGVRQDVAVKVFGENLDTLSRLAAQVAAVVASVPGATAPQVERTVGLPQINVEYDRRRLANYGLNVADVSDVLSTAFASKKAGVVFENERRFDLVVRLDSQHRRSLSDVENLLLATRSGQVPLSQVATVSYRLGPAQISREAGRRRVVVGFNVKDRDVQSVVRDVQAALDRRVPLPEGYNFAFGGQFENLQHATERLWIAVPGALALIFLLLYVTFRSVKQAGLIFTAIPMSAIGGVLALLLRGLPFSISAGVGFIALFGVAVLNGIVLIGTFNRLEKGGMRGVLRRVLAGTTMRLRPVLMTAAVAGLGFLPMALSMGAGAEVQRPLATVVIGGLISATFLTLFVLPLLYYIVYAPRPTVAKKADKRRKLLALGAALLVLPCVQAQEVPSLDEARVWELALRHGSSLRADALLTAAARAREGVAGELPKLDLTAQVGQYSSAATDYSLQVEQRVPFPTVFGARRRVARAETRSRVLEEAQTRCELRRTVRWYCNEVQFLVQRDSLLRQLDSLYAAFIGAAEVRYRSGDTKKSDISAAQTQRGEVRLQLRRNATELAAAYAVLYAAVGADGFVLAPLADYRPQEPPAGDTATVALLPRVQLLQQEATLAEENRRLARAEFLPDFTLGYTNQSLTGMQTIGGTERYVGTGHRFHAFTVGLSLPLSWGAAKARARSWRLRRAAAEESARRMQATLAADLANAQRRYADDLRTCRYYRDEALPNARLLVEAAALGYRAGETGQVEYLYALQTAAEVRLNGLAAVRDANRSAIEIEYLTQR